MPDSAPEADVAETCEPPPEHDHHEWQPRKQFTDGPWPKGDELVWDRT